MRQCVSIYGVLFMVTIAHLLQGQDPRPYIMHDEMFSSLLVTGRGGGRFEHDCGNFVLANCTVDW